MYRQYMSREDYDRIVREYPEKYGPSSQRGKTYPHCNTSIRHQPGACAYCDGFYLAYPEERRPTGEFAAGYRLDNQTGIWSDSDWSLAEANGWGGNQAPIIDDEKAAQEDEEWKRILGE